MGDFIHRFAATRYLAVVVVWAANAVADRVQRVDNGLDFEDLRDGLRWARHGAGGEP